jgi:hypothetical protein
MPLLQLRVLPFGFLHEGDAGSALKRRSHLKKEPPETEQQFCARSLLLRRRFVLLEGASPHPSEEVAAAATIRLSIISVTLPTFSIGLVMNLKT